MDIDLVSNCIESLTINETSNRQLLTMMEHCSINEENECIITDNIFQHNLDIYNEGNKKKRKLYLDIPNTFCQNKDKICILDDEDYIYNYLTLPLDMQKNIFGNKSIQEYSIEYIISNNIIIDYNEKIFSIDKLYAKTIYIYQFVNFYNTSLSNLPLQQRVSHLPIDILKWVDNVIIIIKQSLIKNELRYHYHHHHHHQRDYFDELLNGLNLCAFQLKMIINHHNANNINMYCMSEKFIEKFFRILNNLCIIMLMINFQYVNISIVAF